MSWRTLLGLSPTRGSFAQDLMDHARRAGSSGWTYNAQEFALLNTQQGQSRVNLANLFLEYSNATRRARPGLLRKYMALLTRSREVPRIWTVAAGGIYPALRSRYGTTTVEINQRDAQAPFPPQVIEPWRDDVSRVLLYDFGEHMITVSEQIAEVWGIARDALWARALANLRALPRPRWERTDPGVFRIVSNVSYEESFLLLDEVTNTVPITGRPVFAIPNRGIALAADSSDPVAMQALVQSMRHHLEHSPWPLSAGIFEQLEGKWRCYEPTRELATAVHSMRVLDLARTYHDQKAALDKLHQRTNTEIFVASCVLRTRGKDSPDIESWCTWSAGVLTLLPKTDNVIFNATPTATDPEIAFVRWSTVEQVCGAYLQTTREAPQRFRVDRFPTGAEWDALKSASARHTT